MVGQREDMQEVPPQGGHEIRGGTFQGNAVVHPGIVHQHVEAARLPDDLLDQFPTDDGIGEVAREETGSREVGGEGVAPLGIAVGEADPGPFAVESMDKGLADSGGAAGDQDDAILQFEVHWLGISGFRRRASGGLRPRREP